MADAPAAPDSGPSSTPVAAEPTPATIEPTQAAPATEPVVAPSTPAPAAVTPEPAQPITEAPVAPLFTLPEDMKFAPEAVSLMEASLKPLVGADGKISATPQQIADLFVSQATSASTRWGQQVKAQNDAWAAEAKTRFSPAQLTAAETGVGFLSSFDPQFREVAQQFKNHPSFVNAMRIVGERLSEDTFEIAGSAPTPAVKSKAERMGYAKPKTN